MCSSESANEPGVNPRNGNANNPGARSYMEASEASRGAGVSGRVVCFPAVRRMAGDEDTIVGHC